MKKLISNLQNKYIIEFIRKDKDINQYIFYINFLDVATETTIVSIECGEENFYNMMEKLYYSIYEFMHGYREFINLQFINSFNYNIILSNCINNDLKTFNLNILKVDKYRLYRYDSILSVINTDISENELISILQNMYNLVDISLDLLHKEENEKEI